MRLIPVPTKNLIYLLLVPLILVLVSVFIPSSGSLILIADIAVFLFAAYDLFQAFKNRDIRITVDQDHPFYMNQNGKMNIDIKTGRIPGFSADFRFDLPDFWQPVDDITNYEIKDNREERIEYSLKPMRRGKYEFEKLHFRFLSSYSLFHMYGVEDLNLNVSVYPDYRELKEYYLLSKSNRLYEMGIHKNRYKGHGTEMES